MLNDFYYFLLDKDNRSYFQDVDGSIQSQSLPRPLQNKPIGWKELEPAFDTVDKYFSNVKALSVPMQYVLDGAAIIRWLLYRGKGYNEEVYVLIVKYNAQFSDPFNKEGLYELEYKGQLDLLNNVVDQPGIGITVNAKEGGFQADLDANEEVAYEFPLTDDLPNIAFDGITLFDIYKYSSYEFDLGLGIWIIPMVFDINEGDSVGVIAGTQQPEKIILTGGHTVQEYVSGSSNNLFETVNPLHIDSAKITFSYTIKSVGSIATTVDLYLIINVTPTSFAYVNLSINAMPHDTVGATHTFDFDVPLDLIVADKVFLAATVKAPGFGTYTITVNPQTKASIEFTSINNPSFARFLTPLETFNRIVKKWSPAYSVQSNFLTTHNNIVYTSGQSLRGLPSPVLKRSFKQAWDDYNNEYCLAITVIGNVMYIEQRKTRYGAGAIIFDLGTVTGFKIKPEATKVINTIKVGYPKQEYNERNGKYEVNTEVEWKSPAKTKGELNLISTGRGDPYGIEFIRGKLNNKDTTDAASDNEAFLINVTAQSQLPGVFTIDWTGSTKTLRLYGQAANIALFPVGKLFETVTQFVPDFNYFLFSVVSAAAAGPDLDIVVKENPLASAASFPGSVLFPYKLTRRVYDSQPAGIKTPNTDGPGALFNIEEMTPKRRLLNWGSWLHSVLFQLPGEKLTFQTSEKNADLVTVLNGVTISEKADILIASLDAPFFLNYSATFTAVVPLRFSKIMSTLNSAGNVRVVYNGFELFLLPVGKMTSKPATHDAQEWELLIGANNNLGTLYELSQEGLYISDGMNNTLRLSPLNPVHFIYYDKTLNPRYKYKDLFDDWEHLRNDQFAVQPGYVQKWEFADTVKLQGIANGLSTVELYLHKAIPVNNKGLYRWQQVTSINSTVVINTAVRSPYTLLEIELLVSDYDEGFYCYELRSNGFKLAISTIQHFAAQHPGTYIFDYWNTYNTLNAYFLTWRPMVRVEAEWGTEKAEGSNTDYQDETRLQTLGFDTYTTRRLQMGYPYGVPEWVQILLNFVLRLDRAAVEGTLVTLPADSKWEINEHSGYPYNTYAIDLRRSNSLLDFAVTDEGAAGERAMLISVEAEAFGQGAGVIEIEPE